jgi:hypothetical protein
MPRPRKYVNHIGFQATDGEYAAFKRYLEKRELTATEFFRKQILRPLLQAQGEGQVGDDRPTA